MAKRDFLESTGKPLIELLSDPMRSYNIRDVDILENFVDFSRDDTLVNFAGKQFQFSRNIRMHLPLVTAPMPDVTDGHIATVAAKNGALGIIPATFSPDEQARAVRKVKKTEGGFIEKPFALNPR